VAAADVVSDVRAAVERGALSEASLAKLTG
jgi:hypothetical protein